MSCDVGEVTESLENQNELWRRWSDWSLENELCFTYVTAHSPTLPSLYLRHSSFSNPSVASPTSQFILQPFFHFSYITSSSLNSPGEPPKASRHAWHTHTRACARMHTHNAVISEKSSWRWGGSKFLLRDTRIEFWWILKVSYYLPELLWFQYFVHYSMHCTQRLHKI